MTEGCLASASCCSTLDITGTRLLRHRRTFPRWSASTRHPPRTICLICSTLQTAHPASSAHDGRRRPRSSSDGLPPLLAAIHSRPRSARKDRRAARNLEEMLASQGIFSRNTSYLLGLPRDTYTSRMQDKKFPLRSDSARGSQFLTGRAWPSRHLTRPIVSSQNSRAAVQQLSGSPRAACPPKEVHRPPCRFATARISCKPSRKNTPTPPGGCMTGSIAAPSKL